MTEYYINTTIANDLDAHAKTRKSYTGTFKAKILRELLNGKSNLRELSDRYQIHPNQIKNWKILLLKRAPLVLDDKRRK